MKSFIFGLALLLGLVLITGCNSKTPTPIPTQASFPVSTSAVTATPQPTRIAPTPTATPAPAATQATAETSPTQAPTEVSPTAESSATSEQPTAIPTSTPIGTQTAKSCTDLAGFYGDLNVPDGTSFRAGDKFTKTWRFRNEGDCTWTPDYQVVFYSGEIMNAPLSIPFPGTVAPGDLVNVSVDLEAPGRGGSFTGNWEFSDSDGRRFGTGKAANTPFWVTINVSYINNQGVALPSGGGSPAPSGAGSSGSAALPAGCNATENSTYEAQVIALINQARQQNGLSPLQENSQLDAAAAVHSADMACNNFMNHTGSDGSTWYDRVRVQGYAYSDARENIYSGPPQYGGDPQGAFNWWMNSQVHRDNILNSDVTDIGVGYFSNPQSQYTGYYTVVFGRQ